jgi:aryl-alcohol dehydrogenase-like predicted oxidoreductase
LELVAKVEALARDKGATPAQVALAWVLAQGDDIVPIPGTRKPERVAENAGALQIRLTPDELGEIDAAFPPGVAAGERYPEAGMQAVNL